jgi:hypothetical protein
MALEKNNKVSRDKKILDDYKEMFFTEGKREEIIFMELEKKYFLKPTTLARIVRLQISKL